MVRLDVDAMASDFVCSQFHEKLVQFIVLDTSCGTFQEFTWQSVNVELAIVVFLGGAYCPFRARGWVLSPGLGGFYFD